MKHHIENAHDINFDSSDEEEEIQNTKRRRSDFDELILKFIISAALPFRVLENAYFKRIFKRFHITLPSRHYISGPLLDHVYDDLANATRAELHGIHDLSLTLDFWQSKQCLSYLGCTAHFLNEELIFKSKALMVKHVATRHTRDVVADCVSSIIEEWNLRDKIVAVVTDNAANMLNIAADINANQVTTRNISQFHCSAHILNLIVQNLSKHCRIER
jgi:hypothetical protein